MVRGRGLTATTEKAVTHGSFAWNERYTRDVEAAKAFYAATIGWTFEGMRMPHENRTYWIAKAEGKPAAASSTCAEPLPILSRRTG
jgi:predicted enzyme related to lactoylglutathione lyase